MSEPLVTVLLPAYNAEDYIMGAMESILCQSFDKFELIVVDDGSSDSTLEIIRAISDKRIRIIVNERNIGLVATLNRGFAISRGRYVARIDADDLAKPNRLQTQVRFFERNSSAVLVASAGEILDGAKILDRTDIEPDPIVLACMLHFTNFVGASSVMFRRDVADLSGSFVNSSYQYVEDFEFLHRMLRFGRVFHIPDALVTFRRLGNSMSRSNRIVIGERAASVLLRPYQSLLGLDAGNAANLVAAHFMAGQPVSDLSTFQAFASLINKLFIALSERYKLNHDQKERLVTHVADRWWRAVRVTARSGKVLPALLGASTFKHRTHFVPPPISLIRSFAGGLIRPNREI